MDCDACNDIPPCPPCSPEEECRQLYPNACHLCPQNVCVKIPAPHTAAIVYGTVGAALGTAVLVACVWWVWRRRRRAKRRAKLRAERLQRVHAMAERLAAAERIVPAERRAFTNTDAVPLTTLTSTLDKPSAPPPMPIRARDLWRISERTEPASTALPTSRGVSLEIDMLDMHSIAMGYPSAATTPACT